MTHLENQHNNGSPRIASAHRHGNSTPNVLESLIASSALHANSQDPSLVFGAVIGTVMGWNDAGKPLVMVDEISDATHPARVAGDAVDLKTGMDVVILFERGDPKRPIVMAGLADDPATESSPNGAVHRQLPFRADDSIEAKVDDDRIVLKADREIVLKCGKASLTLTRAGKILIRGSYVSSRSSGVNRLKGGSVQIN